MTTASLRAARVARSSLAGRIYLPVGVLALVIAIVGFWPTYFSHLVRGTLDRPPVFHLHAVVFTGWLLLLIAQASLAGMGRIALHRRIGRIGIGYGVILVAVGLLIAFYQFAVRVRAGDMDTARIRLLAPFSDMVVFAPVLWAAWRYRNKPETHKRLMVVATTILLVAAVHRMTIFGAPPAPTPLLLAVWLSPIALAMAHDFIRSRMVHPAYLIGVVLVLAMKFRAPLRETGAWRGFTGWLATFFVGS